MNKASTSEPGVNKFREFGMPQGEKSLDRKSDNCNWELKNPLGFLGRCQGRAVIGKER
jgi:hypothetical protein